MVQYIEWKIAKVHQRLDAFELRVLARPAPPVDVSTLQAAVDSLRADIDMILEARVPECEAFLGMYFHLERREIKVEKFINLKQVNMSVAQYSLKFSTLSRYAPSLLCNPRDEMSHFVKGVADLVMEEYRRYVT